MRLSDLAIDFVLGMVSSMYRYEADEVCNPNLLTEAEIMDFYYTYCGR